MHGRRGRRREEFVLCVFIDGAKRGNRRVSVGGRKTWKQSLWQTVEAKRKVLAGVQKELDILILDKKSVGDCVSQAVKSSPKKQGGYVKNDFGGKIR